jgi:hypothetical protein
LAPVGCFSRNGRPGSRRRGRDLGAHDIKEHNRQAIMRWSVATAWSLPVFQRLSAMDLYSVVE